MLYGYRTGPPGWESIHGLLKRSTNTGSVQMFTLGRGEGWGRSKRRQMGNSLQEWSKIPTWATVSPAY